MSMMPLSSFAMLWMCWKCGTIMAACNHSIDWGGKMGSKVMWLWWTSLKLLTTSLTSGYSANYRYRNRPRDCIWSRSFLCGRTQNNIVVVDREASDEVGITTIKLILVYINDTAKYTKTLLSQTVCRPWQSIHQNTPQSDCMQTTPSWCIYLILTSENDWEKLQEELQALERWEADWLMEFHPDECSVIRITMKKTDHGYPYPPLPNPRKRNKHKISLGYNSRQHDMENLYWINCSKGKWEALFSKEKP